MALKKSADSGYGVFDYWVIAPDFTGNRRNDQLILKLFLYQSRDYEHSGNTPYLTWTVTIKFSDWVKKFIANGDWDDTRASYDCVKILPEWQDAISIFEEGQTTD